MIPGIVAQAASGSSSTPTERWWRVRFPHLNTGNSTGTGSNNYCDIRYVAMAASPGGTNLVPSYTDYKQSVIGGNLLNAVVDNSSLWNNSGIHVLGQDMWGAFKLPVADYINEVKIRNHNGNSSYSPFSVLVESSWDGINWTFEWGQARVTWGGAELKTFVNPEIDWSTATYRDWLVQPYKTTGFSNFSTYEMEMADTLGGSDLCSGGTPRSENNGTYPASNLTDNNTGTLCGSTGQGKRSYVGYSFPSPVNIVELRMWRQGNEDMDWGMLCVGAGTPGSFAGPWYVKQLIYGQGIPGSGYATYDFRRPRAPAGAAGAHRYWRIRPTSGNLANNTTYAIAALDFKDGGSTLIGSGTPISSTENSGSRIDNYAFDGDPNTAWASASTMPFQWLGYDFGSAVLPDEFSLAARNDSSWNQIPRCFSVDWSDDGMQWYSKAEYDVTTIAGAAQSQTFAL